MILSVLKELDFFLMKSGSSPQCYTHTSYIFTCTSRTGYCINYIAQIIAQITEEYPKNAKHYTTTTKPTVNKDRRPKRGTFGDRFDGSDLLFKQGENLKIENNFTYAEHAHKKGIRKFLS